MEYNRLNSAQSVKYRPVRLQFQTLAERNERVRKLYLVPETDVATYKKPCTLYVVGVIVLILLLGLIGIGISNYQPIFYDDTVSPHINEANTEVEPVNLERQKYHHKKHSKHHHDHFYSEKNYESPNDAVEFQQKKIKYRSKRNVDLPSDTANWWDPDKWLKESENLIDGITMSYLRPNSTSDMMCRNFYDHACGNYDNSLSGLRSANIFQLLQTQNDEAVKHIITEDQGKLGTFYNSCIDHFTKRQQLNESNLSEILQFIIDFKGSISEILGWAAARDIILPFQFSLELDPLDAQHLIPTFVRDSVSEGRTITHGNFSDPYSLHFSHDAYFSPWFLLETAQTQNVLPAGMFQRKTLESWASEAYNMEMLCNKAWNSTNLQRQNLKELSFFQYITEIRNTNIHRLPLSQVHSLMKGFMDVEAFWKSMIEYLEVYSFRLSDFTKHDPIVWVIDPYYMEALSKTLFLRIKLENWKSYLVYSVLSTALGRDTNIYQRLPYTFHHEYNLNFALPWNRPSRFTPKTVGYSTTAQERCIEATISYLPVLVDDAFLEYLLDFYNLDRPEDTEPYTWDTVENDLNEMVELLKSNLEVSLWQFYQTSGDPLAKKAAEKIESIHSVIIVPSTWDMPDGPLMSRNSLDIMPNSTYLDNIHNIRQFHQKLMLEQLSYSERNSLNKIRRQKHSRNMLKASFFQRTFDLPIHQVNAFYHAQLNSIIINAGILLPPFYHPGYDPVTKFSKLAMIIGHELTHSIDFSGIMFTEDGSFLPPAQNLLSNHFLNSRCFIELYSDVTPLNNLHNSLKTLNENIADISGFTLAYNSLMSIIQFNDPYKNDIDYQNFVKYQFFLSYGQLWCTEQDKTQELRYIDSSTHSVGPFRVNKVLSQQRDFINIFNCRNTANYTISHCNLDSLFV